MSALGITELNEKIDGFSQKFEDITQKIDNLGLESFQETLNEKIAQLEKQMAPSTKMASQLTEVFQRIDDAESAIQQIK